MHEEFCRPQAVAEVAVLEQRATQVAEQLRVAFRCHQAQQQVEDLEIVLGIDPGPGCRWMRDSPSPVSTSLSANSSAALAVAQ